LHQRIDNLSLAEGRDGSREDEWYSSWAFNGDTFFWLCGWWLTAPVYIYTVFIMMTPIMQHFSWHLLSR
jgi:hypothetical protein